MEFTNIIFLFLFLPGTALIYYSPLCRKESVRNLWLILASLGFYAWGEPVYVLLFLLSIAVNYLLGRWLASHAGTPYGKRIVFLACLYDLGILFLCKNYLGWMLGKAGFSDAGRYLASHIPFPLGISFFTFQALSYIVDIYRKQTEGRASLLDAALYLSFFPKIIEGPIVRYRDFCVQTGKRERRFEDLSEGVWLFCVGLTKKVMLADRIGPLFREAAKEADRSVLFAWTGILAYMLSLYYDFSGYSDMAIGLARMFGFRFSANFDHPYLSKSLSEYWSRWHISMGEFFREYLYYPLTLGPGVKMRKRLSGIVGRKASRKLAEGFVLLAVWAATGLWHGAGGVYLVWGLLNFACLFYEQNRKKRRNTRLSGVRGWTFTMLAVAVSSVLFAMGSLKGAGGYLYSMLPLPGNALWDEWGIYLICQHRVFLAAGLLFCFPVTETVTKRLAGRYGEASAACGLWNYVRAVALALLFGLDIVMVMAGGYSPSVYRNF